MEQINQQKVQTDLWVNHQGAYIVPPKEKRKRPPSQPVHIRELLYPIEAIIDQPDRNEQLARIFQDC